MTLHPRFARLARFATGDDPAVERTRTAVHVSRCPSCRTTVSWVRNALAGLRAGAGPTPPDRAWARVQSRLEAGDVVLLPEADAPTSGTRRRSARGRRMAIAALLVLAAGAAAATVPTPARDWIERSIAAIVATTRGPRTQDVTAAEAMAAPRRTTVIVPAANGRVALDVDGAEPGLELRIRTTDASALEVQASGPAAAARFHTGTGRLSISQAGAGVILVRLPRAVERATVGVDGTVYIVKRGDELRVLAPLADTAGSEIVLRPARHATETMR